MLVTLFGIVILARLLQYSNAMLHMLSSLLFSPNVTLTRLVQPENALPSAKKKLESPMLVTLLGIDIFVSAVQPKNVMSPMLSSLLFSPNVTLVRLVQPSNAPQSNDTLCPPYITVTLSGIAMLVRDVHLENAAPPMLVTLFPILTEVKPVQPENAPLPMLVTLSGMVIEVKPSQSSNARLPMLVTLPSAGITLFLQPAISVLDAVSIRQSPFE